MNVSWRLKFFVSKFQMFAVKDNVLPVEDPEDTDILELELLLEHEDKDSCDGEMETLLDSKQN